MSVNNDTVDMLMWIIHGGNVSSEAAYVKYDNFKFATLLMYGMPFELMKADYFKSTKDFTCHFLSTCPYNPIPDSQGKQHVYVPPLLFSVNDKETPELENFIGLYHIVIKKVGILKSGFHGNFDIIGENDINLGPYKDDNYNYQGRDICETRQQTKLIDYFMIKRQFGTGNITYSQLFNLCELQCNQLQLNMKDVVVGIFSCKSKINKYVSRYKQTTKNLISKVKSGPALKVRIYKNISSLNKSFNIGLTCVPFNNLKPKMSPIGKLMHQGCAMNVLTYFDIIDTNTATELTTCLNLTGTSIFEIVNYIDLYLSKHIPEKNSGYIILRMPVQSAVNLIIQHFYNYSGAANHAIIFKLYETIYQPDNINKFSQVGHTVSIAKSQTTRTQTKYHIIDPQLMTNIEFDIHLNSSGYIYTKIRDQTNSVYDYLITRYAPKNYIDLIFSVRPAGKFEPNQPIFNINTFEEFVNNSKSVYVSNSNEDTKSKMIEFSNKRLRKSSTKSVSPSDRRPTKKRRLKSNSKSKTKSDSISISLGGTRKTKKTSNRRLLIQEYLELNKELDKKYNIKTNVKPV